MNHNFYLYHNLTKTKLTEIIQRVTESNASFSLMIKTHLEQQDRLLGQETSLQDAKLKVWIQYQYPYSMAVIKKNLKCNNFIKKYPQMYQVIQYWELNTLKNSTKTPDEVKAEIVEHNHQIWSKTQIKDLIKLLKALKINNIQYYKHQQFYRHSIKETKKTLTPIKLEVEKAILRNRALNEENQRLSISNEVLRRMLEQIRSEQTKRKKR